MTTINDLNQYCLIEILSYVEFRDRQRLELVCKRWREINQIIWRSIRKLIFTRIDDDAPSSSSSFTSGLKVESDDFEYLRKILKKSDGNLVKLAINTDMKYVKEIDIPDCIYELIIDNDNLNSLEIAVVNKQIYSKCLKLLKTKNLQHLKLHYFLSRSDNAVRDVIEQLLKNVPRLETLYLGNISIPMQKINKITTLKSLTLMSNDLSHLSVKKFKFIDLQSIHLANCEGVNDKFIQNLVKNCSQLCHVEIMAGNTITNKGLISITKLANLRHFSVSRMDDEVFDKLSNLETFSCPNLSLDRYSMKVKVFNFFRRSPNLRVANVCLNGYYYLFNEYVYDFGIELNRSAESYFSCFCNISWRKQFYQL